MCVATMYNRPVWAVFGLVCIAMCVLCGGCQSTRVATPVNDPSADGTTRFDPSDSGFELEILHPDLIDTLGDLYSTGRSEEATAMLEDRLEATELQGEALRSPFEQQCVQAAIDFNDNPASAIRQVQELTPTNYVEAKVQSLLESHMHGTLGDCQAAVDVLSSFSPVGDPDRQYWARRIWEIVSSQCIYRSDGFSRTATSDAQDWWNLASIAQQSLTSEQRNKAFRLWRELKPQHLASSFPPNYLQVVSEPPRHIALMLPQSGPLSSAATAIRNGFLSSHLHHLSSAANQDVRVTLYDTERSSMTSLLDRAITEGVDVIIGPLDKDRVRTVVKGDTLDVPIIALNRVAEATIYNTHSYQLAIVVEDDALAIAQKLVDLRIKRVLLVIGSEFWAARASVSFKSQLPNNVEVVDETVLNDLTNITSEVAEMLHVAQSNLRHEDIQRIASGKIQFTARRRDDIDAVVAFVNIDEFDSLAAAMHYHFAGEIPILAAEPTFRDSDGGNEYTTGTTFTSMPALIYSSDLTHSLRTSFSDAEVLFPLYVFGSDAYKVALNLTTLKRGEPIYGHTGMLSMKEHGVISRLPIWGQVDDTGLVAAPDTPTFQESKTLL